MLPVQPAAAESLVSRPPTIVRLDRLPRHPGRLIVASLLLGLLAELLLDGGGLGLGFTLFGWGAVATLVLAGQREGWQRARRHAWVLGPLLFFAAMVAVRSNPKLTFFNVGATAALALLLAQAWGGAPVGGGLVRELLRAPLSLLLRLPWLGERTVSAVVRDSGARERLGPKAQRVVVGVGIALPVLVLFGVLLASGDALFAAMLDRVIDFSLTSALRGLLVIAGGALLAAGWLSHALRRFAPATAGAARHLRIGAIEALVVLVLVDLLFLGFAAVQAMAAVGGPRFVAEHGLSWSAYARSGFFQLLAAALFALTLLVAVTARQEGEAHAPRSVRVAATVLIALLLGVVASALHRMALYERAFGYTELRLGSAVFMWVLGGLLVWRGVTLWWREERFAAGVLVAAIAWVGALDVLNPDALIARRNLARAQTVQDVDLGYLLSLGDGAVPTLAAAAGELEGPRHDLVCDLLHRTAGPASGLTGWTLDGALAARARATCK